MRQTAVKTIKAKYPSWGVYKVNKFLNKHLKLVASKYPEGLDDYFVLPGFEKHTNNQPVLIYNVDAWVVDVNTILESPKTD